MEVIERPPKSHDGMALGFVTSFILMFPLGYVSLLLSAALNSLVPFLAFPLFSYVVLAVATDYMGYGRTAKGMAIGALVSMVLLFVGFLTLVFLVGMLNCGVSC